MTAEPDPQGSTPSSAASEPSTRHEIGILFLHGIGEQAIGQTLHDFGEPLCIWMQRWLDGLARVWQGSLSTGRLLEWLQTPRANGEPAPDERTPDLELIEMTYGSQPQFRLRAQRILEPLLTLLHARKHDPDRRYRSIEEIASAAGLAYLGGRASLRPTGTAPASLAPSDPPHTVLDLELVRADGTIERVSWLMAESHWAQSFTRPAFMSLALWILLVAPWTVASYFGRQVRRQYRKIENASGALTRGARVRAWLSVLWRVVLVPLAAPLALFIQLAMALLMLAWTVPIPFVRNRLRALQSALVGFLGDAYAFAGSPMRSAEIVGRVLRDMQWLEERSEKLVIVAHSQGAAVSYMALLTRIPASLKLWFTFGSGLLKLGLLQRMRRPGEHGIWTSVVLAALAAGYGTYFLGDVLLSTYRGEAVSWVKVAFFLIVFLHWVVIYVMMSTEEEIGMWGWAELLTRKGVKWVDCFSAHDPVPAGAVFEERKNHIIPDGFESIEVTNLGSFWGDHTAYWSNRDEFVATLASRISTCAESRLPLSRLTPFDAEALAGVHRRRAFRVVFLRGARLVAVLGAVALLAARWKRLDELGARVDAGARWLFSVGGLARPPQSPVLPVQDATLGALAIVGAVWLAWRILQWVWEMWDAYETYVRFGRSDFAFPRGAGVAPVWKALIIFAPALLFIFLLAHFTVLLVLLSLPWTPPDFWTTYRIAGGAGATALAAIFLLTAPD